MRLIDLDRVLGIFNNWLIQLKSPEKEGDRRGVERCIEALESIGFFKIADEDDEGEWIMEKDSNLYHCSKCGFPDIQIEFRRFCSNCGTKMKVKSNINDSTYEEND